MNTKRKIIIPLVLAVLTPVLVLSVIFILPMFSTTGGKDAGYGIDHIIYGTDYTLELTSEEKDWLKENETIKLGIDRAFPPFGSITENNEYIGFSADFMKTIEYRLKIKFDIAKDAPWGETIEMAKAGKIDMISALVNTQERQKYLNFTEPFAHNPTIIINNGLTKGHLRSLENLNGKQVAVEKGSYAEGELSKKYPEIFLVSTKNTKDALKLVSTGIAEAYVGNAVTASYLIKKYHFDNLSFSGQTEYSSDHSIGILKSNPMLTGIMKKALASISEEDRSLISNHWFGMAIQPSISVKKASYIGLVLVSLMMLLLGWALSLTTAKNKLKRSEKLLIKEAETDHLTGLDSRRKFYRLLEKEIETSNVAQNVFTLINLDIDGFKEINDSLGLTIGDLLLTRVAKRIKSCVDDTSKIARLGGDEFMIILSGEANNKLIEDTAKHLKGSLSMPFYIEDNEVVVSASIGITTFPDDGTTAEQLIINSDQAVNKSKRSGKNCHTYFNVSMKEAAKHKNNTIRDLRRAEEDDQLVLHYQPIIDLSSNKICKAEALIRWNHPKRGLVSPNEFIPLAEESGLINSIGEWTFKEAISETVKVQKLIDEDFQMSINTSPIQFNKNGMDISVWYSYLRSYGLSGENLIMEITEGILMEQNSTVMNNLYQLKDLNIQVAIDDFGTGYSSLSYLKKFNIDLLKIDQSFVKNLKSESDEIALVQAIIIMAHKLGCKVIAEGIETKAQHDILIEAGCDYGQGYLYSKPLTANDFEHFITHWDVKSSGKTKTVLDFKKASH